MTFHIRPAALEERKTLEALIALSARELSQQDYTSEQIEGALRGAFGVDTQLIEDGTYFVVELHGRIVACGGWSLRGTLFGSDARNERDASLLNPKTDAARIRAFFIHPEYARRGIGRALLEHCEAAAQLRGFTRFQLMATLPGQRLYAACGYRAEGQVKYPVAPNVWVDFVPMTKTVQSPSESAPSAQI